MKNIEIGEYVRTKDGIIAKLIETMVYELNNGESVDFLEDIVKHSKQLIDLIEIGDILKIKEGNEVCYIGLEKDTTTVSYKDIKASIKKGECELLEILTKEQFSANCYKVGGE